MKYVVRIIEVFGFLLIFATCTSVSTFTPLKNDYRSLPKKHSIMVYNVDDALPQNLVKIGFIQVRDPGTAVDCHDLDNVIKAAQRKAMAIGGDILKITRIYPGNNYSVCYELDAEVYINGDKPLTQEQDSLLLDFSSKYSRSNLINYYDENSNLDPIEGIYKFKVFNNNHLGNESEVILFDLGIKGTLKDGVFILVRYDSWMDTTADIWGTCEKSAVNDLYYGNKMAGTNIQFEMHYNQGIISGTVTLEGTSYKYELTKMLPARGNNLVKNENEDIYYGSGFLISTNGYIVTNYHVIAESENITVKLHGSDSFQEAAVVIQDKINDIVILKIPGKEEVGSTQRESAIPFQVANSKSISSGANVFTLGFPLSSVLGNTLKTSSGIISSVYGIDNDPRFFQIDCPIQPGNSGGPLFDNHGNIVGIVVSSLSAKYFFEQADIIPQNVNFAIKSNYLINLIDMVPGLVVPTEDTKTVANSGIVLEDRVKSFSPYIAQIKVW